MVQVTSTGIPIVYDDLGQGEPVLLFMPGWCSNRTVFEALAARCSLQRRTLVLDWRGHGESGPAADDFGNNGLVEDALAVIQASGAQQVVPVAHDSSPRMTPWMEEDPAGLSHGVMPGGQRPKISWA